MSCPASPVSSGASASTSTPTVSTSIPSVPIYKPSFDWNSPHPYEQFKLFKQKVDYLLVHGPYKDLHASMKVSIFLNWLGDRSYELINTIEFPPTKSKSVLKDVIEQFDLYFKPSQSTFQSWYELGSLYSSQFKNQSDFLNKLIDVSKDCNLNNPNELVKFLFLVHNQNAHVRENLLKDMKPECTLQDCLQIAKLTEGTVHVEKLGQNFLANVDKHSQNVDAVNRGRPKSKGPHGFKGKSQSHSHSRNNGGAKGDGKRKVSCRNCGTSHPPRRCPAYGKKCHNCGVEGHYKALCRSRKQSNSRQNGQRGRRPQHEVEQEESQNDWAFSLSCDSVVIQFTDSVTKVKGNRNVMFDEIELSRVLVDLNVQAALHKDENCTPISGNGRPLHKFRFKLDSGAHGNLMPKSMFQRLYPGLPYSELRKSIDKRVTLVAYNKQEIKQLGQCCVNVCNSSTGKSKTCKFFVVEDKCNPIIGLNDSIALQLLSVNVPFTDKWTGNVHSKRSNSRCDKMETEEIGQQKGQLTRDYILKKYAKLFKGIGRFQCTPAKIQLKSNAVPVQKPARRIPVALKDEFQKEINTMVKDGILTKLDKNQATWNG